MADRGQDLLRNALSVLQKLQTDAGSVRHQQRQREQIFSGQLQSLSQQHRRELISHTFNHMQEENREVDQDSQSALSTLENMTKKLAGNTSQVTKKQADDVLQCGVCLDVFKVGATVRYLPCQHHFHLTCVNTWLQGANACPYCRKVVPIEM